ncbi:F420-dependent methylenetetrahydromethanopterin dehydrogenase [Methanocaldococcus infernus]
MVKVGIVKCGNIGTSLVVDLALDERAERDINVLVYGSGAKMNPESVEYVVKKMIEEKPDLIIYIGPNPAAPGPRKARELLSESKIPSIIIGDAPGIKVKDEMEKEGLGYILIKGDPMIGARREFLDPTEVALFNSDILKVLAVTGVVRLVQEEIDRVIEDIKEGKEPELPRIVVDAEKAVERMEYSNPYAKAKAIASYSMAEEVANIDVKACFMVKEPERYIILAASAHELLRQAAKLADEARELEKATDMVSRKPHAKDGRILSKRKLLEKPQ